jgi:glycosyltransferase involved in cell wall biosynthesis
VTDPVPGPLVTVVIPTLGRPALLEQAVQSVITQDYDGPVECLVVLDDAVTALPTLAVAALNRTGRVVRNSRSPGPAGARNTGVLDARGEIVAFLDDDDVWLPAKLRMQVDTLTRTGVQAAGSSIVIHSARGSHDRHFGRTSLTSDDLRRGRHQVVHQSTMIARRAYITDSVGLFDEQIPYHYGEDLDWLLRATAIEPVGIVAGALVAVRWHEASFFSTRWDAIAAALPYLINKHPVLLSNRPYSAALLGRIAFAHAALGHRREALRWLARSAHRWPIEPRVLLTAATVVIPPLGPVLFRGVRRSGRSI